MEILKRSTFASRSRVNWVDAPPILEVRTVAVLQFPTQLCWVPELDKFQAPSQIQLMIYDPGYAYVD